MSLLTDKDYKLVMHILAAKAKSRSLDQMEIAYTTYDEDFSKRDSMLALLKEMKANPDLCCRYPGLLKEEEDEDKIWDADVIEVMFSNHVLDTIKASFDLLPSAYKVAVVVRASKNDNTDQVTKQNVAWKIGMHPEDAALCVVVFKEGQLEYANQRLSEFLSG